MASDFFFKWKIDLNVLVLIRKKLKNDEGERFSFFEIKKHHIIKKMHALFTMCLL